MSSKRASEIFARLNRDARQIDNWDAPSEAERFVEAAIVGKEIDLETTKELIRAFMRLSTQESSGSDSAKEDEAEEVFVSGE